MNLIKQAEEHKAKIAIKQGNKKWSYNELLQSSAAISQVLLMERNDLYETRVAFMVNPGFDYVSVQWGIWRAGGIAVPLCLDHPVPALQYVIEDAQVEIMVVSESFEIILKPICDLKHIRMISLKPGSFQQGNEVDVNFPTVDLTRRAMILYTSGTTNLPKGVVSTHRNLETQISTLVTAWEWGGNDQTLCVLPLHHVHGIVNVVCCALWSGACCEFLDTSFSPSAVFSRLLTGEVNVFMAVPTIYYKLIAYWEKLLPGNQIEITTRLSKFRLMVSGSAALPVSMMDKWYSISQHRLLERYGMTEIGMGISNPYRGERRAGHVGVPLPGVQIRLCNEADQEVFDQPGEIQVKGANVFLEYWNRKEATEKSFSTDGWFRTGDIAERSGGYYKILGRNSVDIIKSGGYKISALEIEEILRTHPDIIDCSVVGLENEEWGELIVAAYVSEKELKSEDLAVWTMGQLPKYKTPRLFKRMAELPRNSMGKVVKGEVKKYF